MLIIGSDHAGYDLKNKIINKLKENNIEYNDVNPVYNDKDDYPDVAFNIAKNVLEKKESLGIAICGTGIGISIACNKVKGIRASVISDEKSAILSKKHNNLNVMCLGARLEYTENIEDVLNLINVYIKTEFEGERHMRRLDKISKLEDMFNI